MQSTSSYRKHHTSESDVYSSLSNAISPNFLKGLCIIESTFLSESSVTLMSANYPLGFPEDELMTWQFIVPPTLRASVFFLNYTKPNCERKEQRLEYFLPGYDNPEVYLLKDSQPMNIPGNFNLSLQGCDQDNMNPGALRLLFKVDVHYPMNEDSKSLSFPSSLSCIFYLV